MKPTWYVVIALYILIGAVLLTAYMRPVLAEYDPAWIDGATAGRVNIYATQGAAIRDLQTRVAVLETAQPPRSIGEPVYATAAPVYTMELPVWIVTDTPTPTGPW